MCSPSQNFWAAWNWSAVTLKYRFPSCGRSWRKCIQLFCQVRGRATAAVPGLLHFPHGSAAAEGWDRDLVHRVFPSVFSISVNTLSLQGWAGTMVCFTCALPAKRIKSGISSHAIILTWRFKALEFWQNPLSGSSTVILIDAGQVGIADVTDCKPGLLSSVSPVWHN